MNEEIRKSEIPEEELEEVSGGENAVCGGNKLEDDAISNETMLIIPIV